MLNGGEGSQVAVLYQNDDFGKDSSKASANRLGDKAAAIMVREVSYEVTDATVDSQCIDLASTKANVFLNTHDGEVRVQASRKAHELAGARAVHRQSGSLDWHRHAAGGHRGVQGHHLGGVRQGSDRSQYRDDPEFQTWSRG